MELAAHLIRLRPVVAARIGADAAGACTLFFSVADGRERALVRHVRQADFDAAWRAGAAEIGRAAERHAIDPQWVRIDWVRTVEELAWDALCARLAATRRNYFRCGLAFDPDFRLALLEQELNANAVLYGGAQLAGCEFNVGNFTRYAKQRFGDRVASGFTPPVSVHVFQTEGAFSDGEAVHRLAGSGLDAGRRSIERLELRDVDGLIANGARYLTSQMRADGQFEYGWFPCFDRPIGTYNALRHASTLYAMLEAWELLRSEPLWESIGRGLQRLTEAMIRTTRLADGSEAAFLVEDNGEIKLGGNAVCLLALVKHAELSGDVTHLSLLERLGRGIEFMQDPASGSFVHVLEFPDLQVKEAFRIIYYDGEAAFGLMRLYALTRDERWLAVVEKAFRHFIAAEHWKAHDHWLAYCTAELVRHRPEEAYFRFALRNVEGYLDFVMTRETTFPTLLELMMATRQTLQSLAEQPRLAHLLADFDVQAFDRALEHRAHYLLNGHFWPEFAMYFKNPTRIVGSFFIRHHAFRVRIDDVEHYLSGFVAYRRYLHEGRQPLAERIAMPQAGAARLRSAKAKVPHGEVYREGPNWNAVRLLRATGGCWRRPPASPSWAANGLCIWGPSMEAGQMVAIRPGVWKGGVPAGATAKLPFLPQALLVEATDPLPDGMLPAVPVLEVGDLNRAVLAIGRYARSQLLGRIVGVTGSAGKTTLVAMLACALRPWGEVGRTRHNANLPHGIAWNLASIPWNVPHVVMEMAIGRMHQNAAMVRPHVAVFTNIAPAHLEYHGSTAEVARKKARIFDGMDADGVAVLNRDMDQWPIVAEAARARGLRILHYGEHPEAEVRLLGYDPASRRVRVRLPSGEISYVVGAPGLHMAFNSLACLAVVEALGLPASPATTQFELFRPLQGRGEVVDLGNGERQLRVIDEAYNANPVSMRAALQLAREHALPRREGRRVLILGDMLELGDGSRDLHLALDEPVLAVQPDLVLLCGAAMHGLFERLRDRCEVHWRENAEALNAQLLGLLADGDLVLVKSSAGTGLSTTVAALKSLWTAESDGRLS